MENTRLVTGHNNHIEKHYDYGVLGDKNTYLLDLERVVNRDQIPIVDEYSEESIDTKLIYAHPSQLPMDHGTITNTAYSGSGKQGYKSRHINDSAQLFVAEEPPFITEGVDFGDINAFLVGDRKDEFLEGHGIKLQAFPSNFNYGVT